ncbi:unnamed protein product [Umbelopsis sp. WA50703]
MSADHYVPMTLRSLQSVNHDTALLRLDLDKKPSSFPIPSSVYIKDDAIQIMRPYTPINNPSIDGHIDLLVKRYENGSISKMLCQLKQGDDVHVRGPMVEFEYQTNAYEHVGMIAGGTGITPMYQLMQRILSDPKEINTKVTLIYANKTENDILLRPELEKLERQYPDRLKIYCTLDHPPTDSDWKGGRGYVSREMVVKYLPEPRTNHAANSGVFVFVSGPEAMLHHVCGDRARDWTQGKVGGILKTVGFNESQVWKF